MPAPSTYATAQQIFLADLVKNLYANNSFLLRSRNWNSAAKGKTVNWNQAGSKPGVVINRDTTTLTPAKRTDILRNYNLDEYQTMPTTIDWTDEMVINYAKRADIIDDHGKSINDDIAKRVLYKWAAGASIVRTSGTARPAKTPSATGNRNAANFDNFVEVVEKFASQDIEINPAFCSVLVPALMLEDMFAIEEFKSNDYLARQGMPVVTGSFGQIMGFAVFVRSTGVLFNQAGPVAQLPKADDSTSARTANAADNQSLLFWHSQFVTRAISPDSLTSIVPAHGAVELSATMIAGADKYRNGGEGIVALVEDAAA